MNKVSRISKDMLKPRSLCIPPERMFPFYRAGMADADFFLQLKTAQEKRLAALQLQYRLARLEDIPRIEQLVFSRYPADVAAEISPFDTYRYVRYGQVMVVEDASAAMVACAYEVGYNHPDCPSYLLRLVVRKDMESQGLATLLNRLASALGYERGARSRHALLDSSNQMSLYVHLNKVGSYFRDLVDVPGKGIENHFISERPLNALTQAANGIDDRALMSACDGGHLPNGWRLVDAEDLPTIRALLRQHQLHVVAATPPSNGTHSGYRQKLLLTHLESPHHHGSTEDPSEYVNRHAC